MLFSSHATVAPGSENHETLVKTCTLKRKTEGANKKLDLTCIFNRFVRCASSLPPPPLPLLLPWSAAVRFSIKRRKTAAQLGQTNLFISSCYVAISMVRMKLVCLFCAVWKNELVEWLKSLEQNFKATRACSPFPNSRSPFLVLVTSYLKLQYP